MIKDITGNRYGDLKAIYPTSGRSYNSVIWAFECKCGNVVERSLRSIECSLHHRRNIGCGCRIHELTISKYQYMIGHQFGKITVNDILLDKDVNAVVCLCMCTCGKEFTVRPNRVSIGTQTSCSMECRVHNPKLSYGMASAKQIYRLYQNYAGRQKLYFDLSFDQFMEVAQSPCYKCGARPSILWSSQSGYGRNGSFTHNKIAYIDVDLGYTYCNILPACLDHLNDIRVDHRNETKSTGSLL